MDQEIKKSFQTANGNKFSIPAYNTITHVNSIFTRSSVKCFAVDMGKFQVSHRNVTYPGKERSFKWILSSAKQGMQKHVFTNFKAFFSSGAKHFKRFSLYVIVVGFMVG